MRGVSRARHKRRARDLAALVFAWLSAVALAGPLVWVLWSTIHLGGQAVSWAFLTEAPADAGRAGGIAPMLVATVWIVGVAMVVTFPLGLGAAIWLADADTAGIRGVRGVRWTLNGLAAVPSIVFGLFGNAFFCQVLGLGYSILSGGLTLSCMVLPVFVRVAEQAIRDTPSEYRLGAAALGLSRFTSLFKIVLPTAAPGIGAGFVLGCGRALAETAALVFTAGYVTRFPQSWWDSGRALSVHVYDLAMNVPGGDRQAFAAATVLLAAIVLINSTANWSVQRTLQWTGETRLGGGANRD